MNDRTTPRKANVHDAGQHPPSPVAAPGAGCPDAMRSPIDLLQAGAGNRAVSGLLGRGSPLPDSVRVDMERRFRTSFEVVRVHDDPVAHAVASAMRAKALTNGSHLVFGENRFDPASEQGKHLLAHELAHVVQQRRGGPVPKAGADPLEAGLESSADRAADDVIASDSPVQVGGASAPGVALAPDPVSRALPAQEEPDRTDLRGGQAWRRWLAQFSSMTWNENLGLYISNIDPSLPAWDDRQYQERRGNVEAYFTGRVGTIGRNAEALDRALAEIDRIHDTALYKPLVWWLESHYGVQRPGQDFDDATLGGRVYAHQAEEARDSKDYLAAFDYLETARVALERAGSMLKVYREGLQQASASSWIGVMGSWGDVIGFLLGVVKGALAQITELADTAFWVADEARTKAGGTFALAAQSPQIVPLAIGHDLVKAAGMVDPTGRPSVTAAFSTGMDVLSSTTQSALGTAIGDEFYFTAGEYGQLAGALGVQAFTASSGVKEVQLAFEIGGAVQSLRVMVNATRDSPDWASDMKFQSGLIGLLLGLLGLGTWGGKQKATAWILNTGVFTSAIPVVIQLKRDLNDDTLREAERQRRVKEAVTAIVQIVLAPLLQRAPREPGADAPTPGPTSHPSGRINQETGPASGQAVPGPAALPDAGAVNSPKLPGDAQPDNVLLYRRREKTDPSPPLHGGGELVEGRFDGDPASTSIAEQGNLAEPMQQPQEGIAEAELQMAVGYSPPSSGTPGPRLAYDADSFVASTGPGNGDRGDPGRKPLPAGPPKTATPAPRPDTTGGPSRPTGGQARAGQPNERGGTPADRDLADAPEREAPQQQAATPETPRADEFKRPGPVLPYIDTSPPAPRPRQERTPAQTAQLRDWIQPVPRATEPMQTIGTQEPATPMEQPRAESLIQDGRPAYVVDALPRPGPWQNRSPAEIEAVRRRMKPADRNRQPEEVVSPRPQAEPPADRTRVITEDEWQQLAADQEQAYWTPPAGDWSAPARQTGQWTRGREITDMDSPADLTDPYHAPPTRAEAEQQSAAVPQDADAQIREVDPDHERTKEVDYSDELTEEIDRSDELTEEIDRSDELTEEIDRSEEITEEIDRSDEVTETMEGRAAADPAIEPTLELRDPTLEIADAATEEVTPPSRPVDYASPLPMLPASDSRTPMAETNQPAFDFEDAPTEVRQAPDAQPHKEPIAPGADPDLAMVDEPTLIRPRPKAGAEVATLPEAPAPEGVKPGAPDAGAVIVKRNGDARARHGSGSVPPSEYERVQRKQPKKRPRKGAR